METRFPLVGPITARDSGIDKDQRYINCFPEKLTDSESLIVKRAGLKASVDTTDTTTGRGVYDWIKSDDTHKLISVWGNSIYDSATEIGTNSLTNTSGRCYFATATDSDLLVLETHDTTPKLHYYDGTTFSTVSDGDFPASARSGLVQLDGYAFVLAKNSQIHNSDLNDVTAWGPNDYVVANMINDDPIGIARHINYLVYFGSKSLLFYDNKGNTSGSPLGRLGGTGTNIGCAAGDTIVNVERTVFWVAKAHGGGHFIAALEGLQPIGVSTKPIEEALDKEGGDLSSAYAYTVRVQGHSFYVLTLPTTVGKTFAYDITEGIWTEWTSYNGSTETYFTGVAATEFNEVVNVQDEDNGEVYELDAATYQDDSNDILVEGHTLLWDEENSHHKTIERVTVVGDRAGTDATDLSLSWSDDDYTTFVTDRTLDLNDESPFTTRCGRTQRRSFRYKFANNFPMRLRFLEILYNTGKTYGY